MVRTKDCARFSCSKYRLRRQTQFLFLERNATFDAVFALIRNAEAPVGSFAEGLERYLYTGQFASTQTDTVEALFTPDRLQLLSQSAVRVPNAGVRGDLALFVEYSAGLSKAADWVVYDAASGTVRYRGKKLARVGSNWNPGHSFPISR